MKNLFLIIVLIFFILFKGFSQGIPGPIAGSASLQINGVQIKRNDQYTHPIANQNIVLGAYLTIYPGVFDDLNLIVAYVYKNGHVIASISGPTSTINYSFAPVDDPENTEYGIFPTSMYLTFVIPCDDPSYGPGDYVVTFQYRYLSIYDYNHYTDNIGTITGTVDGIPANSNLCGTYTGSTTRSASLITNCSAATLQSGSHTTLTARQNITFSSGFTATSGSNMHAFISNNGCIFPVNMARLASSLINDEIPEPSSRNSNAYPNPTTGLLYIPITHYSKNSSYVFIYNSMGEEIYSQIIAPGNDSVEIININLSNYASGVYTLKVASDNNTFVQKIILEK